MDSQLIIIKWDVEFVELLSKLYHLRSAHINVNKYLVNETEVLI